MNDQDKDAFNQWWETIYGESMKFRDWQSCDDLYDNKHGMEKAWQAALDYERKKARKTLKEINEKL